MHKSQKTWQQFEELVRLILENNGFTIDKHFPRGHSGYDFNGLLDQVPWAIEVKYYRTARPQAKLIELAATRVAINGMAMQVSKAMLVVSCAISPSLRMTIEERIGVVLVDLTNLRIIASGLPELLAQLESLVETDPDSSASTYPAPNKPWVGTNNLKKFARPVPDQAGEDLCKRLRAIERGKPGWPAHEEICDEILQYLFSEGLHGWRSQRRPKEIFDFRAGKSLTSAVCVSNLDLVVKN